jgi:hypothetical protein
LAKWQFLSVALHESGTRNDLLGPWLNNTEVYLTPFIRTQNHTFRKLFWTFYLTRWAFAITWRPSSVNFSHFNLLLWNPLAKWTIRNKNCLWRQCLLTDRDEISNFIEDLP